MIVWVQIHARTTQTVPIWSTHTTALVLLATKETIVKQVRAVIISSVPIASIEKYL